MQGKDCTIHVQRPLLLYCVELRASVCSRCHGCTEYLKGWASVHCTVAVLAKMKYLHNVCTALLRLNAGLLVSNCRHVYEMQCPLVLCYNLSLYIVQMYIWYISRLVIYTVIRYIYTAVLKDESHMYVHTRFDMSGNSFYSFCLRILCYSPHVQFNVVLWIWLCHDKQGLQLTVLRDR